MKSHRRSILATFFALALSALASPAPALEAVVLDIPSDDVSPYSFIPLLPRGDYHTMYTYELGLWEDGYTHDQQTFLRYDLPPDLVLPDEEIVQASLIMVYAYSFSHWPDELPPDEVPVTLEVREILQPWSETTLTWANRPAAGPVLDAVEDIPFDDYGAIELDVTDLVRDWADGVRPNHGFKLTNPAVRPMGFWSKEAFEDYAAAGQPLDEALRSVLVVVLPEPAHAISLILAATFLLGLARTRRRVLPHPGASRGGLSA